MEHQKQARELSVSIIERFNNTGHSTVLFYQLHEAAASGLRSYGIWWQVAALKMPAINFVVYYLF